MKLESIKPKGTLLNDVFNALPKHYGEWSRDRRFWIAGGAPRRAIEDVPFGKDIDLFFTGSKAFADFMQGIAGTSSARIRIEKPHAVEISLIVPLSAGGTTQCLIQAVRHAFFYDIEALLADFDYTMCQFAFDGAHIWYPQQALDDLNARVLRPNNTATPTAMIRRLVKYHDQGFRASDDAIKTILRAAAQDPPSIDKEVVLSDPAHEDPPLRDFHGDPQFAVGL